MKRLEEMTVADLPNVLQKMIERHIFYVKFAPNAHSAKILLDDFDFTKATNEERLAYCELVYPKGTKFKCLIDNFCLIESFGKFEIGTKNEGYEGYIHNFSGEYCYGVVYLHGKFAEIVSRPEETQPDFKEGEMVEVSDDGKFFQYSTYKFFASNKHWTGSDDDVCCSWKHIRKINPDRKYLDLANEILNNHQHAPFDEDSTRYMLVEMGKMVDKLK